MNDFNTIHALYHSEIARRALEDRKQSLQVINTDFMVDLPDPIRIAVDHFRWQYCNRKWFHEAWEEYRKHVLEAGLGGKIKMPESVFNKYLDKYELKELEKIYATGPEAAHSEELCEDYLAHHGVKGQKWGVRRYQNEDGTLTPEGEKKYGKPGEHSTNSDIIRDHKDRLIGDLIKSSEDMAKIEKLKSRATELSRKHKFDLDDGGGGVTEEDKKAGAEYYHILEQLEELEDVEMSYRPGGKNYRMIEKKVYDHLVDLYGKESVDQTYAEIEKQSVERHKKEKYKKIAAGMIAATALLGVIGSLRYSNYRARKKKRR